MNPQPERRIRHAQVHLDHFLPDAEVAALYATVLAREAEFQPSFTGDYNAVEPDIRRSLVLNADPALVAPVVSRVQAQMPAILAGLRLPVEPVGVIEAQITAHGDGAYFGVHTDANDHNLKLRYLTYVYYFNGEPKGYQGGELRLFDDVLRNNKLARADSFQTVPPRHNSIVFFWARVMHEVPRVDVPSRAFRDARFTVNGWVNKRAG